MSAMQYRAFEIVYENAAFPGASPARSTEVFNRRFKKGANHYLDCRGHRHINIFELKVANTWFGMFVSPRNAAVARFDQIYYEDPRAGPASAGRKPAR